MIPESVLRRTLEEAVGETVPDVVWDRLVANEYVSDALREHEEAEGKGGRAQVRHTDAFNLLVTECRELLAICHAGRSSTSVKEPTRSSPPSGAPGRKPRRKASQSGLGAWEQALSRLVHGEAKDDLEVRAFRDQVLSGTLLQVSDIPGWMQERAAEGGGHTVWLSDVPVPLGHSVSDAEDGWSIHPPFQVAKVEKHGDEDRRSQQAILRCVCYLLPDESDPHWFVTGVGTVLDRLRELSERLADRYCWYLGHATTFVLADEVPPVMRSMHHYRYRSISSLTRIELTVDPTFTPEQVADLYRQARKYVIPQRYRPISEKHMALAEFAALAEGRTVEARRKEWNRQRRQWSYQFPRQFGRDLLAARKRLLHPTFDHDPYATDHQAAQRVARASRRREDDARCATSLDGEQRAGHLITSDARP